jgi:Spy/CpxP family protein refolding chaperone
MKVRSNSGHVNLGGIAAAAALLTMASSTAIWAQGPGGFGGGPGGGGPGGMGRGGGMRGMGGPGRQMEFNVVTIPTTVLAKTLSLTASQTAQITEIQNGLRAQRQKIGDEMRAAFPRPDRNGDGSGHPPTPPDPATMQAAMEKMRAAQDALQTEEQARVKEIRALLTPEQLAALKMVEGDAQVFATVGIPVEVLAEITLTADERAGVTAVFQETRRQMQRTQQQAQRGAPQPGGGPGGPGGPGGSRGDFGAFHAQMEQQREATYQKALAALTAANRATVEAYVQAHPRPQFGGPGGGPGGRGGFGGPPPPPPNGA